MWVGTIHTYNLEFLELLNKLINIRKKMLFKPVNYLLLYEYENFNDSEI